MNSSKDTHALNIAKKARNLLVASHALQHIAMTALPPLLLFIASDVGLSGTELGFIVAAGSIASGIFQMPAGWLADKFTPRRLLIVGYCFTLSGLFLLSRANSLTGFIVAQIFYGIGNSTFHPASFADVGRAARHSGGLAMNMAMHNIGGNVGTALGYSISGFLAAFFGWRSALTILVAAGAALVVGFYLSYPALEDIQDDAEGEDITAKPQEDTEVDIREKPRINYWTPVYVVAAATLFSGMFDRGIMMWLPTFFMTTRGSTTAAAALFSTIMMLAGAGGSLAGGAVGDRFNRGNVILISAAVTAAFMASLVLLPIEGVILTATVMALGFFHSLARPSLSAITTNISPKGMSGTAFGIIFGVMSLGGAVSGPLVGYIYDVSTLNLAFLILAGFLLTYGLTIAGVTRRYRLSGQSEKSR